MITGIFVPAPEPGTRSAYQKYGEKESFDWPLADAGVVLVMEGTKCRKAAIVLGVAAPTPMRSSAAEAVLTGKTIDEATARAAAAAAMQIRYAALAEWIQNATLSDRHLPHDPARRRTDAARPKCDRLRRIDMTTQLVQLRCTSLRSKSSYGAFGDFAEDTAELTGFHHRLLVSQNHGQGRSRRALRPSLHLPRGPILLGKLRAG